MAWIRSNKKGSGGGGGSAVQFTETQICTNSSSSGALNMSEDYHNYQLLKFVDSNGRMYLTTPDILDEVFSKSNNNINFNNLHTALYHVYRKSSNTSFSSGGSRTIYITAIYGITCNKTITITDIYKRGGIASSTVTPSSTDLLSYDIILYSTCTGGGDETIIPENYFVKSDIESIYDHRWILACVYNNSYRLYMSNTSMGSYQWFMIQGIKFT